MRQIIYYLIVITISFQSAFASEFDSSTGKLTVSCVKVNNDDGLLGKRFFNVILQRQIDVTLFKLTQISLVDSSLCSSNDDNSSSSSSSSSSSGVGTADIRLRCETRANRSKVSVDGKRLNAGNYFAEISSGTNQAVSPLKVTNANEVEFDFDSQPDDIAEGATAISTNFIRNNVVNATIKDSDGNSILQTSARCRSK